MAEGVYFAGADATLSIGAVSVAAIHGWSFTLSWDVNDLYGSSSIFKIASARYNQKVEVKIKYAKFDPAVAFIKETIEGDGTTEDKKGSIFDTSKIKRYDVVGTVDAFEDDDGDTGTNLSATITNVYLEGIPLQMQEMDWIAVDLTGIGDGVTIAAAT